MQRIATSTADLDKFGVGKNGFKDGNRAEGIVATQLEAAWFDHLQEEVCSVIEGFGVELDAASKIQLYTVISTALGLKAPLASPTFTGTPAAPTADPGTNTTQVATTAFVKAAVDAFPAASETVAGKVELATAAETTTGTDATRAVHPAGLKVELDKKAALAGNNAYSGVNTFGKATYGTKSAVAAADLDLSLGNTFSKTISGNTTFTISNCPAAGTEMTFYLALTNGGSAVVAYPSGSKFVGGVAPVLTAAGKDLLGCTISDGGTTLEWFVIGRDIK